MLLNWITYHNNTIFLYSRCPKTSHIHHIIKARTGKKSIGFGADIKTKKDTGREIKYYTKGDANSEIDEEL